jgi:hypothetical protein
VPLFLFFDALFNRGFGMCFSVTICYKFASHRTAANRFGFGFAHGVVFMFGC